jgi:hypothetical protein
MRGYIVLKPERVQWPVHLKKKKKKKKKKKNVSELVAR